MIAIDLSKQKTIKQINSTKNIERDGNTTMFLSIQEIKENIFDFSQGTVKVLLFYFSLI